MNLGNQWYRNAIIYAIDVARFADSDGDGIGDLRGLIAKLPYLDDLGVTCLWLLPFYPSPNRDNGYDVADYYEIHSRVGTLDDFIALVRAAGEHGIQIFVDLVVNHTSDQHPWFKAARLDAQSALRRYYVWADTPPPVPPDLRSAFPGEEDGVWTFDQIANAFYFHKFYRFEPDLDLSNPDVRDEIVRIMDFWLSLGISGFRLDAAGPMMMEKGLPGTRPDNPHAVLRGFYDFLKKRRPNAAMIGEVDLSSTELQSFFDSGGKLDLFFNFILNNYIYLALVREEGDPILTGLRQLPNLPDGCQWATFLRNLDELNLARLGDDERQEVMEAFAPDETMRIFGHGIRRRLAPILGGDQRRIELAFSLLMSLPGTPLLVYGDEIGMGDDLSREGRDAVRAPMQWSAEKNAGFSKGKAAQRFIATGAFSYKRVNVAAQKADPRSLFNRIKRLILLRRRFNAIASSPWHRFDAGTPSVLAYGYNLGSSIVVMIHNMSRKKQKVRIALGIIGEEHIDDLFDGTDVTLKAPGQLELELPPYGYRWFCHQKR